MHGAAGWQLNVHAYRRTPSLGFRYASDTRGTHPFIPVIRAEIVGCPQFPTTLPTLDELIGLDGVTVDNVAAALLERTAEPRDHVFTLHAELEGARLSGVLDQLLTGWKAQGFALGPVHLLRDAVEPLALARCWAGLARINGRAGTLLMQGDEFLGDVDAAR